MKQDYSCWYCDQRFTQDKSVSKHICHNRCRNINYYRYTKDKSVFINNVDADNDFDEFILQHSHAPVKVKRVNDTDVIRIMTGTSGQGEADGSEPNKFPCNECGKIYKQWTSLYRHQDTSECGMSKLKYKTANKIISPTEQVGTDKSADNQANEYFEDKDEDIKPDDIGKKCQ